MTHEEMYNYVLTAPIKELVSPLVYQQLLKNNVLTKNWTGCEIVTSIGQNNHSNYMLVMPEISNVIENNDGIILDTDLGMVPVNQQDENIQYIKRYKTHAQAAFIMNDGQQYILLTSAPTEKEAKAELLKKITMDIIISLDIHTVGKLKRLYSEALMIFGSSR